MYKWQSLTMGNIVPNIWCVIRQVFESLFVFHTLDIKWKYNKEGFQMEMLIMRDTKVYSICRNVTSVPRIGDTIQDGDVRVKVKDVIWHIENQIWVEIQI